MNTSFPLILLPKRVAYVDDQGNYLDALRSSLSRASGVSTHVSRAFIDSPQTALVTIEQEANYWRQVEAMLMGASDARNDGGEARWYIEKYFQDWRRFRLTSVLFIDYAMPGMNGVQLLEQLQHCPSRRVLLTGQADEQVAIRAFNAGHIQMFIPKNTPTLLQAIRNATDGLHRTMCEHLGHLLRSTLTSAQVELLNETAIRSAIEQKLKELEWIEYLVVGQPFGILGMKHEGPLEWLQLETPASLAALAQGMSEAGEFSDADIEMVKAGTELLCDELLNSLKADGTLHGHLVPAEWLSTAPGLLGAVCEVPAKVFTARRYGVENVTTPAELMQSLIRDAQLAYQAREQDSHAFDTAVHVFVKTAEISPIHLKEAELILLASNAPVDLRIELQAELKQISSRWQM